MDTRLALTRGATTTVHTAATTTIMRRAPTTMLPLTILITITIVLAAFILTSARHMGTDTVDRATAIDPTILTHTAIEPALAGTMEAC